MPEVRFTILSVVLEQAVKDPPAFEMDIGILAGHTVVNYPPKTVVGNV